MTITELENKIREANDAYRNGEEIMTDIQFDALVDELTSLDPNNELLSEIGVEVMDEGRKEKLPITMASMNKVKTKEELNKWFKSKNIPQNTILVATPKFDGASLVVEELQKRAFTRGNGVVGQRSDEHLERMATNNINEDIITFGEAIMKRQTFLDKYSEDLSNPRNTVAGKLNDKNASEILEDVEYVRYGLVGKNFSTKIEELDFLNTNQTTQVEYKTFTIDQLSEDLLKDLFMEWNTTFEIDGIILEVNDTELREKLGRETSSNNPCFARAYKGDFEEVKETIVENITWHISKKGLLKPVMNVKSINLDGVNVTNVTGNNAKFVKENNIGIGSVITVKRSGMVIPKLVEVIEATGFELPDVGYQIGWNDNGVELVTTEVTEEQRLKQLVSFFEILEVENMGEGIVAQFFNAGFETPKAVLEMTKEDMTKIDRFGVRKAQKVFNSINDKRNVTLSKLQHASGFFNNLGSKKLLLLEDLNETTSVDTISAREGFSEISANNFLEGINQYNDFAKSLEGLVTISKTEIKEVVTGGGLDGMAFVFSGVRRKDLNEIIENKGGRIASGISAKTTHLIMKVTGSGSAKEKKAEKLGQTILTVEELEDMLA